MAAKTRIERTKLVNEEFILSVFDFYYEITIRYYGKEFNNAYYSDIISGSYILTAEFVDKYIDEYDWNYDFLVANESVSFWLIEKYIDRILSNDVTMFHILYCRFMDMSTEFINKYLNEIKSISPKLFAASSGLSLEYLDKHLNELDINGILINKNVTFDFYKKHHIKLNKYSLFYSLYNMSLEDLVKITNYIKIREHSYVVKNKNITIEFILNNKLQYEYPEDMLKNPSIKHSDPLFDKLLSTITSKSFIFHYLANPNANYEWIIKSIDDGLFKKEDTTFTANFDLILKNPNLTIKEITMIYEKIGKKDFILRGNILSSNNITFKDAFKCINETGICIDKVRSLTYNTFNGEKILQYRRHLAAYRIQQHWNLVRTNPEYNLCKKKLMNDYEMYSNSIN